MRRIPMSTVEAHRNGDCDSYCEICQLEDAAWDEEEE